MAIRADRHAATFDIHVQIEPMLRRHLRPILRIENQVYPKPWTMGIFISELARVPDGRSYLVAKVGRTVVGYCGALYSGDDAHVTNIAVDPRWHRHKIGSRLLDALIDASVKRGSLNLTLEVRVSNRAAQEMYRQFGMAPAGVRRRYYENVEDAIVMWAEAINSESFTERRRQVMARITGTTSVEGQS